MPQLTLPRRHAAHAGRYGYAKQFKRYRREFKILRNRLSRLVRNIRRKTANDPALREIFAVPLSRADQVWRQGQHKQGPHRGR